MESNAQASQANQLQNRLCRIGEGVLMLGAALTGLWLLGVIVFAFLK